MIYETINETLSVLFVFLVFPILPLPSLPPCDCQRAFQSTSYAHEFFLVGLRMDLAELLHTLMYVVLQGHGALSLGSVVTLQNLMA